MSKFHIARNISLSLIIALFGATNTMHPALQEAKNLQIPDSKQRVLATFAALRPECLAPVLWNIVGAYAMGSDINKDHTKFIEYFEDTLTKSPFNDARLRTAKSRYFRHLVQDKKQDPEDVAWAEKYVDPGINKVMQRIKLERTNTDNPLEYGFENLIKILEQEYLQKYQRYFLEHVLQDIRHITDPTVGLSKTIDHAIKLLIESKASVNAYKEEQHCTPLRSAIDNFRSCELTQLMLDNKADPNYCCYQNRVGEDMSYLHAQVIGLSPNSSIIRALIEAKANIHAPWQLYYNPIDLFTETNLQRLPDGEHTTITPLEFIQLRTKVVRKKTLFTDDKAFQYLSRIKAVIETSLDKDDVRKRKREED